MIYVMSDIHGNSRRFDSVVGQIGLRPEDTLYVLGDVIDRYPDGIRILRKLMGMPNVKLLLGNHEYMMLNALDPDRQDSRDVNSGRTEPLALWYYNGGKVTHDHIKHLPRSARIEIFDFLRALPLAFDVEVSGRKYRLVHASPVEKYTDQGGRYPTITKFAVWNRWMPEDEDLEGRVLIFGHTPTAHFQDADPLKIWHAPNGRKIGIDCGSGYPAASRTYGPCGRLACLRLDDMEEFYSEE